MLLRDSVKSGFSVENVQKKNDRDKPTPRASTHHATNSQHFLPVPGRPEFVSLTIDSVVGSWYARGGIHINGWYQ